MGYNKNTVIPILNKRGKNSQSAAGNCRRKFNSAKEIKSPFIFLIRPQSFSLRFVVGYFLCSIYQACQDC
jgi:hypothetical protein